MRIKSQFCDNVLGNSCLDLESCYYSPLTCIMPDKKDCDFQGEKEIKVRSEGVIFPQDM